jgi:hypothetical protein
MNPSMAAFEDLITLKCADHGLDGDLHNVSVDDPLKLKLRKAKRMIITEGVSDKLVLDDDV